MMLTKCSCFDIIIEMLYGHTSRIVMIVCGMKISFSVYAGHLEIFLRVYVERRMF